MQILVDADACSVKQEIIEIAELNNIKVIMFSNYCHNLSKYNCEIVTCDKSFDSADFKIVNRMKAGDIVVTSDYGLATLVLSKKGYPISNKGMLYTEFNINELLLRRHINKNTKSNKRSKIPRFSDQDRKNFISSLNDIINKHK